MVTFLIRMFLLLCALPALAAQDVLLEAELDPPEVRVNAQAVYRLRVLQAVDLADLKITGPSARLADFREIDNGRVYEAQRDGRRYRVHERRYAVFPFASGTLELSGAQATGRILSTKASSPDHRLPLRLDAPSRTLTVLPTGVEADAAPWLPARALTLTENWTTEGKEHRRTVRIEAVGIDATQLPEVPMQVDGMTVHAEAALLDNRFAEEQNVATRVQDFVLTPIRAGKLIVPVLQLPWWHVELDSPALATLPARTIDGLPASAAPATPAARTIPVVTIALATTAVLLAGVALTIWRRRRILYAAWQLRLAYRTGNVHAVRDGLLQWAASVWPESPPRTLSALGSQLRDPGARRALDAIERALYGTSSTNYDAAALKEIVLAVKRDGR